MCCHGYTVCCKRLLEVFLAILDGCCNYFIWTLQNRSRCSMCYNGFTCMLQIYVLTVSFSNASCNCFPLNIAKLNSEGCKSKYAFPACACKKERVEPCACSERSGRDGPTGPTHACNGAGGVARETEWRRDGYATSLCGQGGAGSCIGCHIRTLGQP
jgi:hypothetical protein